VICGVMSRFRQWGHFSACGFMCLFFAALGVVAGVVCGAGLTGVGPIPVDFGLFGAAFAALAVWAMVALVRSLNTQVGEFSYDGRKLRFRSLTSSKEQVYKLDDMAEIRAGQSARTQAYCLRFRDGQQVYFDYSLPNVVVLAEQLRFDLQRLQGLFAEADAAPEVREYRFFGH
jgi:hypothetical protein